MYGICFLPEQLLGLGHFSMDALEYAKVLYHHLSIIRH